MARQKYDDEILPELDRQIKGLAVYEAGFEVRNLQEVVPTYNFILPAESQIMAAVMAEPLSVSGPDKGKLLDSFIKDWSAGQITRTTNTIRAGYVQGRTTPEILRELRDDVGPITSRGLEGLVRTSLQHCATQAREQTWRDNSDIVKRVQMVATLDGKTSPICRAIDGQVFPMDSGPRPPFHPNCRTTVVAVLDSRYAFLSKGATRRERDPETGKVGYAPADETYYEWLKRQSPEFQASVIGPARAKLLNDGGLSAQRFSELQLGKTFKPLTIEQMRKLEPLAFERSGI
jgi:SPP1 gp7 family putative phage head morphogenesis protein